MESETFKCPYCGKEIKRGYGWHIRECMNKYVQNMSEKEKDEIKDLYVTQEKSLVQLSKILGIPYSQLQRILPKIGIKLRNLKESVNTPERKELYEKTMLEHFGCKHNFCKESSSRKKWEKRLLEEEGITNVFQRDKVKKKIRKTMIKRYGDDWKYQHSKSSDINYYIEKYGELEGREKYAQVCYEKGKSMRKAYYVELYGEDGIKIWQEQVNKRFFSEKHYDGLNKKCEKILNEHNIKYEKEYCLPSDKICYYYDFKINNLIIELNGTYWHCSPKKYKPHDLVKFPNNHFILAKDKWEYDKTKNDFARENGFVVKVIWEDEFNEETLLNILKENNYGNCKN